MSWINTFLENNAQNVSDSFRAEMLNGFTAGIYLIGQTTFDPITKELFYWVKVGQTSNLKGRLSSYQTNNPAIFYIDLLNIGVRYESDCVLALRLISKKTHRDEWVQVDAKTFSDIYNNGFDEIKIIVFALLKKELPLNTFLPKCIIRNHTMRYLMMINETELNFQLQLNKECLTMTCKPTLEEAFKKKIELLENLL